MISLHFCQSFSCKEMQIGIRCSNHIGQVLLTLLHSNVTNLACALTNTENIHRDRTMHKYLSNIHTNISRDGTMARLLMAIVVVFLCCHSTKIIVNFYEAVQVNTNR